MSAALATWIFMLVPMAFAQPSPPQDKGEQTSFTMENSISLRDPFRRPTPAGGQAVADARIPELERYELDKLKLVGVITGPRKPKAMVTTPSGKMHIVAENATIGVRHGRIKKIAPGMIEVEEKVVNLLGQEENIETLLEIKDDKEKKE